MNLIQVKQFYSFCDEKKIDSILNNLLQEL